MNLVEKWKKQYPDQFAPTEEEDNHQVEHQKRPGFLSNVAHGYGEGALNSLISALNMVPQMQFPHIHKEKPHIPHLDLRNTEYGEDLGGLAYSLAKLGGELTAPLGLAGKLNKLNKLKGWAGPAADFASGAGLEHVFGENEKGERSTLKDLAGGITNVLFNSRKGKLAKDIFKEAKAEEAISDTGYKTLFKSVEKRGANNITVPELEPIHMLPDKNKKILEQAIKNPTLRNVHDAKSDLGKFIGETERHIAAGGGGTTEKNAVHAAYENYKKLEEAIYESLKNGNNKDLADQYVELTKNFKEKVLPYRNKHIHEYQNYVEGKTSPHEPTLNESQLIEALLTDKTFMNGIGKEFPRLKINKGANSINPLSILFKAKKAQGILQ